MSTGENRCSVLAWRGWDYKMGDYLEDKYKEVYKKEVKFVWLVYSGGSDFIFELSQHGHNCDVVIADREILRSFAVDGGLVPLGGAQTLLKLYPKCIRKYAIAYGNDLFAVPIRWGITSLFVRKNYRRKSNYMHELLGQSKELLIWSPRGYFLPSMGLLAMAISPKRPFVMLPDQFDNFKKLLEDLSKRETYIVRDANKFSSVLTDTWPEIVVCGGDWIISSMKEDNEDVYYRIMDKYDYIFPSGSKPFVFFEMAAVLSSGCNKTVGINLVKLLAQEDVREQVEKMAIEDGNYVSNPTTNKRKIIGPGYHEVSLEEILEKVSPRYLPLDHRLQPAAPKWRKVWNDTIMKSR